MASTELTATAESPNQLYSGTIDPPLQYQCGDLLGLYLPPNVDNNGSWLCVYFARNAGPSYETRSINSPLSSIMVTGRETGSDRPLLALETTSELLLHILSACSALVLC